MKKTMKQIFLITAGILLAAVNLFSQNITVKSSVDNDSLLIGTQMNFNIGINMPVNTSFQLTGPENNIDGHIEILSSKIDSSHSDDHLEVTYHYLITSFDSGHYTIPSYQVMVNNPAGPQNLYTDSLLLTVYSPPVDTSAAIKDIRTVINTPLTFREALPYIAGAVGITCSGSTDGSSSPPYKRERSGETKKSSGSSALRESTESTRLPEKRKDVAERTGEGILYYPV